MDFSLAFIGSRDMSCAHKGLPELAALFHAKGLPVLIFQHLESETFFYFFVGGSSHGKWYREVV
jgi:hypothetical protein